MSNISIWKIVVVLIGCLIVGQGAAILGGFLLVLSPLFSLVWITTVVAVYSWFAWVTLADNSWLSRWLFGVKER